MLRLLTLILTTLSVCVQSVDRKKFRTCDQTGFCRRNRGNVPKIKFKVSSIDTKDGTSFRADLLPVHVAHGLSHYHPLKMNIEVYDNMVVRVRVVEDYTKIEPQRYENPDVLVSRRRCDDAKISRSGDVSTVSCKGENILNVHHDMFRLDLLLEDRVIVSANAKEMFYFEQQHQREPSSQDTKSQDTDEDEPDCEVLDWGEDGKPIYADDCKNKKQDSADSDQKQEDSEENKDCDGCFSESFGGHTDSKPRGPMSVGTDISFLGASEVYGIPEHATKMALKSTRGGHGAYSEPFRLYNLDVFEYELDNSMALYGSIPVMMAHWSNKGNAHTAGVFWFNPSETFVDIEDVDNSKHTHWMSESGVFDLFLMRGPSVSEVLKQYTSLTGTQALPPMFAIGYHQCRWNYRDEPDVYNVDEEFENHDFPYDVLWLDIEHTNGKKYFTWDKQKFPEPVAMQTSLASRGHKMVTIVDPHIASSNGYHVHDAAKRQGLYVVFEREARECLFFSFTFTRTPTHSNTNTGTSRRKTETISMDGAGPVNHTISISLLKRSESSGQNSLVFRSTKEVQSHCTHGTT